VHPVCHFRQKCSVAAAPCLDDEASAVVSLHSENRYCCMWRQACRTLRQRPWPARAAAVAWALEVVSMIALCSANAAPFRDKEALLPTNLLASLPQLKYFCLQHAEKASSILQQGWPGSPLSNPIQTLLVLASCLSGVKTYCSAK